ncbi:MAG TPA: lmo0937 family membrane protein [Rhodothermales bacterium]|nr:lmo0937 family membrane protein [Rhodothermales bacterium]
MLWFILIILIIGWALGYFALNLGAWLHVLLVVAIIILIINLIRGRSVA